jgi:phosphatidylglycerol:prolipoprotein diacylglycerol transferase
MKPLIPWFTPPSLTLFTLPDALGGAPVTIHSFGVLVAAGFLIGTHVAQRKALRDGLDPEYLGQVVTWLVVGTFIGGHIFHGLFYEPEVYLKDPIRFLYVWEGLSSVGGFIACTFLAIWFFRSKKLSVWAYGDCVTYGLAFGYFWGRMGCFSAHDHPGNPTDFFLGVYGICPDRPDTVACHDLGLYEALYILCVFLVFMVLDRKPRPSGLFLGLLPLCYGAGRFCFDFLRHSGIDARYMGLTPAQYVAIGFVITGAAVVVLRRNAAPVRGAATPTPQGE